MMAFMRVAFSDIESEVSIWLLAALHLYSCVLIFTAP